jgi:predicted nucleic acid-binding protein
MESSPIVCNAGPLIALAFVDQLQLLPALYQNILVPEAVWREVVDSGFNHCCRKRQATKNDGLPHVLGAAFEC